jgi:hypothetical protein
MQNVVYSLSQYSAQRRESLFRKRYILLPRELYRKRRFVSGMLQVQGLRDLCIKLVGDSPFFHPQGVRESENKERVLHLCGVRTSKLFFGLILIGTSHVSISALNKPYIPWLSS